jgi:hypothetical protein
VKIPLEVANHPRTHLVWADPTMRGMFIELLRIAVHGFAGKRQGVVHLNAGHIQLITGRKQAPSGRKLLQKLCDSLGYPIDFQGESATVTIPNFSKMQGFDSASRGDSPRSPRASDSDSDSEADSDVPPLERRAAPGGDGQAPDWLIPILTGKDRTQADEGEARRWLRREWERIQEEAHPEYERRAYGSLSDAIKAVACRWWQQRRKDAAKDDQIAVRRTARLEEELHAKLNEITDNLFKWPVGQRGGVRR